MKGQACKRRKLSKELITIVSTASASDEKLAPWIIGKKGVLDAFVVLTSQNLVVSTEIRKRSEDFPLIAISSVAGNFDKERAANCGFNEYLMKPVS